MSELKYQETPDGIIFDTKNESDAERVVELLDYVNDQFNNIEHNQQHLESKLERITELLDKVQADKIYSLQRSVNLFNRFYIGWMLLMMSVCVIALINLSGCTQSTPAPVAHFNYVYKSTGTIERVQRKHFVIPYTQVIKNNIQHRVIK